jgi:hypothetical protein
MSDYIQPDRDISVPFTDDKSEESKESAESLLADDDSPAASPEERITRKQKRQDRIKRLLDEGKQSREEVDRLKSEQGELKAELERLKGFVAGQSQQRQPAAPTDGKDEFDRELDDVYKRQKDAWKAYQAEVKAGTCDEERQAHYETLAMQFEREKSRIHTRRELALREPAQRAEQAGQVWVSRYPEIYRDNRAFQYAKATYERRLAVGEQPSDELVHEVMNETMTTFKLGPKKAPSASDRARMSGLPASGSGGGSERRDASINMTPELRKLAVAAYSDLPEAEAIKKWVNTTGKKMRDRKEL